MRDISYFLYETLRDQHPFQPSIPGAREAARRLELARGHIQTFPQAYQHDMFELRDALDILSYYQAHHAFLLGLDLGLSLSGALEPFQQFQGTTPSSFSARG